MIDFKALKKEIDEAKSPIYFFDDDPDGLCAFLMLYRYLKKGKGIVVKASPKVGIEFASKVNNYNADKAFILDIHTLDQQFVDNIKAKVVWIDHHTPINLTNVSYFNPRSYDPDAYCPTSMIIYNTLKQDLWLAGIGTIADWLVPPFLDDLKKENAYLIRNYKKIEDLYFKAKIGKLIHIFSMIQKGQSYRVMQCVKVLTRIDDPKEILDQTTSGGRFIYKNADFFDKQFQELVKLTKEAYKKNDPLLIYLYDDNKTSFTLDLAQYLIAKYPEKIVVVGREKSGEVKMSLRAKGKNIAKALERSLVGVDGYGGGHECACGGNVKKADFDRFIANFRAELMKN